MRHTLRILMGLVWMLVSAGCFLRVEPPEMLAQRFYLATPTSPLARAENLRPLVVGNWVLRSGSGPLVNTHDFEYIEFYPDGTYAARNLASYSHQQPLKNIIYRGTYEVLREDTIKLIDQRDGVRVFHFSLLEDAGDAVPQPGHYLNLRYDEVEGKEFRAIFVICEDAVKLHTGFRPWCVEGINRKRK